MKAYGIEFTHRQGHLMDAPYVAEDFAEFFAFASLLASLNAEKTVESVFFDSKPMIHVVKMANGCEYAIPLVIAAANTALGQADIDGTLYGKNCIEGV